MRFLKAPGPKGVQVYSHWCVDEFWGKSQGNTNGIHFKLQTGSSSHKHTFTMAMLVPWAAHSKSQGA